MAWRKPGSTRLEKRATTATTLATILVSLDEYKKNPGKLSGFERDFQRNEVQGGASFLKE